MDNADIALQSLLPKTSSLIYLPPTELDLSLFVVWSKDVCFFFSLCLSLSLFFSIKTHLVWAWNQCCGLFVGGETLRQLRRDFQGQVVGHWQMGLLSNDSMYSIAVVPNSQQGALSLFYVLWFKEKNGGLVGNPWREARASPLFFQNRSCRKWFPKSKVRESFGRLRLLSGGIGKFCQNDWLF